MFVCNSSFLTSFWHIVIRFDHWITRRLFIEAACTMAQPLYICKHATRVKQDSSTRKKKNSSYLTRCEQRHAHAELNRNHFKRRHVMMTKQIANERRVGLRRLGASAIRNARTIIFFFRFSPLAVKKQAKFISAFEFSYAWTMAASGPRPPDWTKLITNA